MEIEPDTAPRVLSRWGEYVPDILLVVLQAPYRSLTEPPLKYVEEAERVRDDDILTVILPEFVTDKWWTRLLHGQNGFLVKWALLFKRGVVVTNVQYHLDRRADDEPHPLSSSLDEG